MYVLRRFTKYPSEIHWELWKGGTCHIKLAEDTRLKEVGMHSECRIRIPKAQKGLHQRTDPPAYQTAKTIHSAALCMQLCNCW
jgi:hypothetical protein